MPRKSTWASCRSSNDLCLRIKLSASQHPWPINQDTCNNLSWQQPPDYPTQLQEIGGMPAAASHYPEYPLPPFDWRVLDHAIGFEKGSGLFKAILEEAKLHVVLLDANEQNRQMEKKRNYKAMNFQQPINTKSQLYINLTSMKLSLHQQRNKTFTIIIPNLIKQKLAVDLPTKYTTSRNKSTQFLLDPSKIPFFALLPTLCCLLPEYLAGIEGRRAGQTSAGYCAVVLGETNSFLLLILEAAVFIRSFAAFLMRYLLPPSNDGLLQREAISPYADETTLILQWIVLERRNGGVFTSFCADKVTGVP
ncbi:hypothetical protein HNY73_013337 [Argiope bruennichi]|uniref:Uncharacterized protein n=1 Tax=Argiope bruennichi TaxID=94029 RepID=A0A8T0EYG7_ARGBR|nr:hypothetical protein HNY73_013337 [Argiope bruennichi]